MELKGMARPSNPNSQRAVADQFHITPPRLSKLAKQHSVDPLNRGEVAEMLRRSTSMSPLTKKAVDDVLGVTKKPDTPDMTEVEQLVTKGTPTAASIEEAEAHLRTLQASMATAQRTSEELRLAGLFEDSRRWLSLHSQLGKQYPALHRQIIALKVEHKTLIRCEDAERLFTGFLRRMRDLAERMPAALSGRVNPSDPLHSREELERWVQDTFCKSLHQAPTIL